MRDPNRLTVRPVDLFLWALVLGTGGVFVYLVRLMVLVLLGG